MERTRYNILRFDEDRQVMVMIYVFLALSLAASLIAALSLQLLSSWNALWQIPLIAVGCFLALLLLLLLTVAVSAFTVNTKKPQKKQNHYYIYLLCAFCHVIFPLLGVRVHVSGLDKVPRGTRFLLVSNHHFFVDPLVYYALMPWADLSFIAKQDAFTYPVIRQFMHKLLCLSIDRDNDRAALRTILRAIDLIEKDMLSIAVFPEGGTNRTDAPLLPFRNGVFKIAQKANVPTVVCTITGTRKILKNLFRRHTDVYLDVLDVLGADELSAEKTIEIGEHVQKIMEHSLLARQNP